MRWKDIQLFENNQITSFVKNSTSHMSMHFTNKYYLICEYVLKQKKKKEGKKRKKQR